MSVRCAGCMRLKEQRPICEHCGYDERRENNTHQLPVGTVVGGHFTLGRVLGQGGFGITYLGWDSVLKCPVAVKEFFPSGYAGRDTRNSRMVTGYDSDGAPAFEANKNRFLREAEALAKLWGVPQIVKVLRFFEENGTAYIALEYIEGENLLEYMKRHNRPLTVEELLELLGPVMQALVRVHQVNLVHRDISPDNIMVLTDGTTKLLDFGAARYVENADAARERNTSTQAILKHGFAPPEQYSSHGALGPWSDVYALCATIYFCLTGQKPIEAMNRIIDDQQLGWEKIPGLTRRQINVLNQGMELKPQNRIQSVQQLYDELFGEILEAREKAKQEAEAEAKHREELRRKEEKRQQQEARRKEADQLKKERSEAHRDRQKKREEQGKKRGIVLLAVVTAAVAIAAGLFFAKSPEKSVEPEIQLYQTESTVEETIPTVQPTETIAEIKPEEPWRKNVLMESPWYTAKEFTEWYEIHKNAAEPEPGLLSPICRMMTDQGVVYISTEAYRMFQGSRNTFGSEIPRGQIVEVTFLDTLQDAPENAWDVSQNRDRSVLAWTVSAGQDQYSLFLAGEGGINGAVGCENLFGGYTGLMTVRFQGAFHMEEALSLNSMFYQCIRLTELDVSGFATANVTDMGYMFYDCSCLPALDVNGWDTTNVTNMTYMYYGCRRLSELDFSNWDTANVTDMRYMLWGCSDLTELNLSGLDTGNVTNMNYMFSGCSSLTTLDVSGFDTANVKGMQGMFNKCSRLTALDVSGWDTSKVTNMSWMFDGCSTLTTLDVSGWDISNVTDKIDMFKSCSKLSAESKQLGSK